MAGPRLFVAFPALAALLSGCTHVPMAATPACPAWVDYPADDHSNDDSPYLGCVSRANLELMLDDKHDVIAGRSLGPANGERESSTVKAYEEGKTKTSNAGPTASGGGASLQQTGQPGTK